MLEISKHREEILLLSLFLLNSTTVLHFASKVMTRIQVVLNDFLALGMHHCTFKVLFKKGFVVESLRLFCFVLGLCFCQSRAELSNRFLLAIKLPDYVFFSFFKFLHTFLELVVFLFDSKLTGLIFKVIIKVLF